MTIEDRREQRLKLVEDHIGRALAESERSGELKSAANYGKPLDFGDGFDETPAELRMAMKILKDAGVVPAEVQAMHDIAALRRELDATEAHTERALELHRLIADKQLALVLRLEQLGRSGSL